MTEQAVSTIEKDVVVTMEYELKVDGSVIDSGPIQFLQGHGNIIPGLEAEVEGMSFGDEKEILVKSKDAYGEYNPDLEMDISLTSFPEDFKIELGRPMRLQGGDGQIYAPPESDIVACGEFGRIPGPIIGRGVPCSAAHVPRHVHRSDMTRP